MSAAAWGKRILFAPITRIFIAAVAIMLPLLATISVARALVPKPMRILWPYLLAALLCAGGYLLYVRFMEGRRANELALQGAAKEGFFGVLFGAASFLLILGVLAVCGAFTVDGSRPWTAMIGPFGEMLMVAIFEELLFRAALFGILQRWLGDWKALIISSLFFGLAHLGNAEVGAIAFTNTVMAGVLLGAIFMLTGRVWAAIGFHFAWNFISDGVFALPTSGEPSKGWLQGALSGPDWISGGAYGIEASAITLAVLAFASALVLKKART